MKKSFPSSQGRGCLLAVPLLARSFYSGRYGWAELTCLAQRNQHPWRSTLSSFAEVTRWIPEVTQLNFRNKFAGYVIRFVCWVYTFIACIRYVNYIFSRVTLYKCAYKWLHVETEHRVRRHWFYVERSQTGRCIFSIPTWHPGHNTDVAYQYNVLFSSQDQCCVG